MDLIINADDLGYSRERDEGIVRDLCALCIVNERRRKRTRRLASARTRFLTPHATAAPTCATRPVQLALYRGGHITSASLLVNGASAADALVAAVAAGLPVGLHLNVTEGAPVCAADAVASLLAPPARRVFRGKMGFREALRAGEIDAAELAAEAAAQLAHFRALHPRGAAPGHFDGHQHVHVLPGVREALAAVFAAGGVAATRIPAPWPAAEAAGLAALPPARAAFYASIAADCDAARRVYAAAGIAAPGGFVGYTTMGADASVGRAVTVLTAAAAAAVAATTASDARAAEAAGDSGGTHHRARPVVEWMAHPGRRTVPRPLSPAHVAAGYAGGAGCGGGDDEGGGPDDFSQDPGREMEAAVLAHPELAAALASLGIRLVDYRAVA